MVVASLVPVTACLLTQHVWMMFWQPRRARNNRSISVPETTIQIIITLLRRRRMLYYRLSLAAFLYFLYLLKDNHPR
jgi:hypothetical protein